jgi:hypothetical protein
VLHSLWIKLASPDNFDGDRSKGRAFLTSCELYLSLAGPDYPDEQSCIHWALSFFKSGCAATFSEHIVRQEMRTGVMGFADWTDFTSEFMSTFCPENEAMSMLMRLESDCYFQGQRNVEAYIDEFEDLVNMSGYTDPIAIVLKFRRGLNAMMQDKIAESGTDRPQDNDHRGWYAAAHRFDLNWLANEAFRYASWHPTAQSTMPRYTNSTPACTPLSFSRPATSSTLSPASTHAPMRPYPLALPPVDPRNTDSTRTQKPAALTCYRCGQTGHTSWDCDLRHDVHHIMLDEQDKFIQHIMANRDAEMVAVAESMTSACTSEGIVVELSGDTGGSADASEYPRERLE